MSVVAETKHTNDMGYLEVDVDRFIPLPGSLLVQWEVAPDEWKIGKVRLIRPETFKKIHYTGVVLRVGAYVDSDLKIGKRIIFEQFSGFEKLYDKKYGRLALIKENHALAIIPERMKIQSMDGELNYDE